MADEISIEIVQTIDTYGHGTQINRLLVCAIYSERCIFRPNVDWVIY